MKHNEPNEYQIYTEYIDTRKSSSGIVTLSLFLVKQRNQLIDDQIRAARIGESSSIYDLINQMGSTVS